MDIFSIFTLCGGLAFFLYGISLLSTSLENIAGGKLEKILRKMTSNPFKSLFLGIGITAAIQSSSAVTVMLVGLVNSGIMELSQAIGVIMGSNIGTTATAWILSLSGIESTNFFIRLLKPESFSPILALLGVILLMTCKTNRRKSLGGVFIGFAILMFGMGIMATTMAPLAKNPDFTKVLTMFTNPILGVLAGTIITAIIQSSSASVGILQAVSLTGGLNYAAAIPIIMGQNIGTCISAILSSIGVNTNAKRVAVVHVVFNVLGVVICLGAYEILNSIFNFSFSSQNITPVGIAVVHSVFNIITTILLFPFTKLLEKIAVKMVKDKKQEKDEKLVLIDERLLTIPSIAISECAAKTINMALIVKYNLFNSFSLLENFNEDEVEKISKNENTIDYYEDQLNKYLLKVASLELVDEDNNKVSQLLSNVMDYERIGDHAKHILKVAKNLHSSDNYLSQNAKDELRILMSAVREMFEMTLSANSENNFALANDIDALEDIIKKTSRKIKDRHIQRLKDGQCDNETGFIFLDLINNIRRIAAHCGNIATSVVQLHDTNLSKHEYNKRNKKTDEEYISKYQAYKAKYELE